MKKLFFLITTLIFANYVLANTHTENNIASALAETTTPPVSDITADDPSNVIEYEAVYLNKSEKVVPKKLHERNDQLHYTIDVIYPQIEGKKLSAAQVDFNKRIEKLVKDETEQFKRSVKLDIPHMKTLPKEALHNNLKVDYDLDVLHQLSLVSVRLTVEGMQAGRAHPYHSHRVLNFDLAQNKELTLGDLFKPKANYLQKIAELSHKKLQETVPEKDKWMIQDGAKAVAKNYKNWNVERDAILITFDEYQVAPYVYGPQEVEIPYSELQHLLSPQGKIISSIQDMSPNIG